MEVKEETEDRNSGPDLRICPQIWELPVPQILRARESPSALGERHKGAVGRLAQRVRGMGRADCFCEEFGVFLGTSMLSPFNFSEAPTNQEGSLP